MWYCWVWAEYGAHTFLLWCQKSGTDQRCSIYYFTKGFLLLLTNLINLYFSFAAIDQGKPIHVPRVQLHGNIHFWNSDRPVEESMGSFLVLPLYDAHWRAFGILGLDTLRDQSEKSFFQMHEITFYQVGTIRKQFVSPACKKLVNFTCLFWVNVTCTTKKKYLWVPFCRIWWKWCKESTVSVSCWLASYLKFIMRYHFINNLFHLFLTRMLIYLLSKIQIQQLLFPEALNLIFMFISIKLHETLLFTWWNNYKCQPSGFLWDALWDQPRCGCIIWAAGSAASQPYRCIWPFPLTVSSVCLRIWPWRVLSTSGHYLIRDISQSLFCFRNSD